MATGRWFVAACLVLVPAAVAVEGEAQTTSVDRSLSADDTYLEMVPVENPGNRPDRTNYGAVVHSYQIGRYELTNREYADFLNSVAAVGDPYALYHPGMDRDRLGGILRRGSGHPDDPYVYTPRPGCERKPVNFVSFYDAVRFVNWRHNGTASRVTERGSYTITNGGPDSGEISSREVEATWVVPSEDEWYKAAYYDASALLGRYWLYPSRCNASQPALAMGGSRPKDDRAEPASFSQDTPLTSLEARFATGQTGESESEGYYGTHDQGGSVREWTDTAGGDGRIVRGGTWWNPEEARSTHRDSLSPEHQDALTGIRVALLGGRDAGRLIGGRTAMSSASRMGGSGGGAGSMGGSFGALLQHGFGLMGTSGGGGGVDTPTQVAPPQGPLPVGQPTLTPVDPPNPTIPSDSSVTPKVPDPTPVPTPEPATLVLLASGLLALRHRRRV